MKRECPDCGARLTKPRICSSCGWSVAEDPKHNPDRNRCAFESGGVRCPLMGAIHNTVSRSAGTPGYCRFHIGFADDPRAAAQTLDAIVRGDITVEREDWRDKLMREVLPGRQRKRSAAA